MQTPPQLMVSSDTVWRELTAVSSRGRATLILTLIKVIAPIRSQLPSIGSLGFFASFASMSGPNPPKNSTENRGRN